MHRSLPLNFLFVDVEAELRIHKRFFSRLAAVLQILRPEQLLGHAILLELSPHIADIGHPAGGSGLIALREKDAFQHGIGHRRREGPLQFQLIRTVRYPCCRVTGTRDAQRNVLLAETLAVQPNDFAIVGHLLTSLNEFTSFQMHGLIIERSWMWLNLRRNGGSISTGRVAQPPPDRWLNHPRNTHSGSSRISIKDTISKRYKSLFCF